MNESLILNRETHAALSAAKIRELLFHLLGILCCALSILVLAALIIDIAVDGYTKMNLSFLSGYPSRFAVKAGIAPALAGSMYMMCICAAVSFPLGVGAALYLEEYAVKNKLTTLLELNIANLAGVPSIIYGLLGLQIFVRYCSLDRSLLAGSLTMALLIVPVIIISSREAIRRVPLALREGAVALGATKWEVVRDHVFPNALPGMLTGCILAFSRAIGETAPLITMGALTYVAFLPDGLMSPFTVLPIQAFNWVSRPQQAFHENAAGTILVLLAILLVMNIIAVSLRGKFERRFRSY